MLYDPVEGLDRLAVRLGLDRQRWSDELEPSRAGASDFHASLGQPHSCRAAAAFRPIWEGVQTELRGAGLASGRGVFGGWDDAVRTSPALFGA